MRAGAITMSMAGAILIFDIEASRENDAPIFITIYTFLLEMRHVCQELICASNKIF